MFNVQTGYSLMASNLKIPDYLKKGQAMGYQSLAIADINVLHGVYDFYQKAKAIGVTPLIGMRVQMPSWLEEDQLDDFLVYARSQKGFQGLIALSKTLNHHSPSVNEIRSIIRKHKGHLIYISLGQASSLDQFIIHDQKRLAQELLKLLEEDFSKENVYLAYQVSPFNQVILDKFTEFCQSQEIKMVASQSVTMLNEDDAFVLEVLEAIKENELSQSLDLSREKFKGDHYLLAEEDWHKLLIDNGLENLWQTCQDLVADLAFQLPQENNHLPSFDTGSGLSSQDYLKQKTQQALDRLGLGDKPIYSQQLAHELSVIHQMGYDDYFLIVWDIIRYCRKQGIQMGPGRGSAPGSLVAYLLKISAVDPLKFNLLFERFLNPERYTMPDIDIDIPDNRRQEVIDYVAQKYGYSQVAQIATFGSFKAKQAVRDVLRVTGASEEDMRTWSRIIPENQNQPLSLDAAYQADSNFRNFVNQDREHRAVYETAMSIEGLPRNISTHAAGVVINDFPLENMIPILERPQQLMLTQYTMQGVEGSGLLKMDFLGLKNLTILSDILNLVENHYQETVVIEDIPLDDSDSLTIFRQADTFGVFQFESPGIRKVLKQVQPSSFEDIVAVIALYRPGPMGQINHFVRRKNGQEAINYLVPTLEPILANTYGIIVYQEQVIQILVEMGGFSLGQADVLRRAMSKKEASVMEQERQHFINGAMSQGYDKELAKQVYQYIYEFSNYGFNRAHAVVYSILSYQLAYLKAHYPAAFYVAILNNGSSHFKDYLKEIKQSSLTIYGVDINRSQANYRIDGGDLRAGFAAIKGIRGDFIDEILRDRQSLGPYRDFMDFLGRISAKYLNEKTILPLVSVGAFDHLGYNRATLIHNLPALISAINFSGLNMSLFEEMAPKINPVGELTFTEKLQLERDYLGFTLSGHPVDPYLSRMKQDSDFYELSQVANSSNRQKIKTIGLLVNRKDIQTKQGRPMSFIHLEDDTGHLEGVVFPGTYERYHHLLKDQWVLLVEGKLQTNRQGKLQIVIHRLSLAQDIRQERHDYAYKQCFVQVDWQLPGVIDHFKELCQEKPGPCQVILVNQEKESFVLNHQYQISYSQEVQSQLVRAFGSKNVVFR